MTRPRGSVIAPLVSIGPVFPNVTATVRLLFVLAFVAALSAAPLHGQVITTFAGTDWVFPTSSLQALYAPLSPFLDVAIDAQGNVYAADAGNYVVVRISPNGVLTVVAGNGISGFSGDGGPATSASLFGPQGVAVDSSGSLYIADTYLIRKVSGGTITTVAGNGNPGFSGDGGPATSASLGFALGVAVDSAGNLYIADSGNERIRKVSGGTITTVAGNGKSAGQCDDVGPATSVTFFSLSGVAVDSAGNLYIADFGCGQIRKVSGGTITTVAGGCICDGDGDGGPATSVSLTFPARVAVDLAGNLYISDSDYRIRKVSGGTITTVAGNGACCFSADGGPATSTSLNGQPGGLAVDSVGNLYFAYGGRVRKVSSGTIATVAGNGAYRFSGDGGPATSAPLNVPAGVTVDSADNLYIAEDFNNRIRKVSGGTITTVAGNGNEGFAGDGGPATSASLNGPSGVAVDSAGNLYIADAGNFVVRKVSAGTITTVAGNGGSGSCCISGDGGPATSAYLEPVSVVVDSAGNLYINDLFNNNRIRKVSGGTITTVAGNGVRGFSGDGGPATSASLNTGYGGTALDSAGNLYIADAGNNRIRRVSGGKITTVAGNGVKGFSGDGGPATSASLALLGGIGKGVAVDSAGNLYIADSGNQRIRKVSGGTITTVAGNGVEDISGDGGQATSASLVFPTGVAVDSAGNVYIADNSDRIRVVLASPPAVQVSPASCSFNGQSTGAGAPTQTFSITSVPGMGFSLTVATATGGNWLSVTPTSGAAPRLIDVVADPSKLTSAGTYQGTITVATPNANPTSTTVNVTFTVTAAAPASLAVDRQSFSFSFARATPAQSQRLTVSNTGGGTVNFIAAAAVSAPSGGTWLTMSPASGQATAAVPVTVTVTANPTGLAAGTYAGVVTVSAGGTPSRVPVTMTISALDQAILLSQQGLAFTAVAQGGVIPPQTFGVRNIGTGTVPWTASTSTLPAGLGWLQVTPASGTSDAAQSPPAVTVSVKPDGLAAGVYYGIVQVDAPTAANSPQVLTVFLQVLPAGADTAAMLGPGSLLFSAAPGGDSPGSQNLAVYNITAKAKSFRSSVVADAGLTLVTLPTDATLDPQQPTRMVVQPFTSGLGAGVYNGTVTLQFSDGRVNRVNVKVIVASGAGTLTTSSPESLRRGQGLALPLAACTPKKLVPILTTMPDSFELSVGWPAALAAQVHDDCGTPLESGSVTVSFSNGDAPVQLQLQQGGRWEGTWPTRGGAQSHVTLHLHAEGAQSQIAGDQQVAGSLLEQQQPPVFDAAGIVGVFGGPAYTALAPGAVISIYGDRLAEITVAAPAFPLQTTLAGTGTQVTMQGRKMPLYYGSQGQVNAVVPYGVNINAPQQMIVQRENTLSLPIQVNMAPAQPALLGSVGAITVFPAGGGAPYTVSSDTPANAGDTVVFYCVGLGAVSPAVPDGGLPSELSSAANAKDAQLLIGSQLATVSFMGLTSQFPGLYQVNAVVPQGTPKSGAVPVVLNIGGQSSQPITIAIQ
jgi:uncharacterized protein (TIGR03437 family)